MAKNQDIGYEFEETLKTAFKNIQSKHAIFWHQFPDAKAARGHLQAQPSDFMVASNKVGCVLFEAKASLEKPSLSVCAKSMIRPSQVGMAKKWIRAGQKSVFVFYCQLDNIVEFWDGEVVVNAISNNTKLKKSQCEVVDFFNLEEFLTQWLTVH